MNNTLKGILIGIILGGGVGTIAHHVIQQSMGSFQFKIDNPSQEYPVVAYIPQKANKPLLGYQILQINTKASTEPNLGKAIIANLGMQPTCPEGGFIPKIGYYSEKMSRPNLDMPAYSKQDAILCIPMYKEASTDTCQTTPTSVWGGKSGGTVVGEGSQCAIQLNTGDKQWVIAVAEMRSEACVTDKEDNPNNEDNSCIGMFYVAGTQIQASIVSQQYKEYNQVFNISRSFQGYLKTNVVNL